MSDEYASSGFQGSLANNSGRPQVGNDASATGNYPPAGDTTSSGGYGSSENPWSDSAQRGQQGSEFGATGLVDQSVNGGPIGKEIQDARQGEDERARDDYKKTASQNQGQGLDPYGANPDNRAEAEQMLASAYADKRGEAFESGAGRANDQDFGA